MSLGSIDLGSAVRELHYTLRVLLLVTTIAVFQIGWDKSTNDDARVLTAGDVQDVTRHLFILAISAK